MVEAGWLVGEYNYSDVLVYDMHTEYLIHLIRQNSQDLGSVSSAATTLMSTTSTSLSLQLPRHPPQQL